MDNKIIALQNTKLLHSNGSPILYTVGDGFNFCRITKKTLPKIEYIEAVDDHQYKIALDDNTYVVLPMNDFMALHQRN